MLIPFTAKDWAVLPQKGTEDSAGIDLFISHEAQNQIIAPGHMVAFSTGISMAIEKGHFGLIQSRSSAFRNGLWIHGVIDADYRGEIVLQIRNISSSPFTIQPGKSYAQLIIVPFEGTILKQVHELDKTSRGDGGFGSTGNV